MKRYKEAVDALHASDELRASIEALPQESKPVRHTNKRRIALLAAALAVVIALGAISIPMFAVSTRKTADAAPEEYVRDEAWNSYDSKSAAYDTSADGDYADTADYDYAAQQEAGVEFTSTKATATAKLPVNRKLIRNAQLDAETKEYDRFLDSVNQKLAALNGYIESSESSTNYADCRVCTLVLRVPAASLDDFLSHVSETATVRNMSTSVQDMTNDYIDVESRIAALETEQETLLGLLKKAENLTDTLEIQDRLSEVRASLESMKGRLKALDSQIDYSAVTMRIYEVERESTPEKKTFFAQVRANLSDNLYDIGQGFRSFGIWFLSSLPYIALWLLGIGLAVFIIVRIRRRRRRKL